MKVKSEKGAVMIEAGVDYWAFYQTVQPHTVHANSPSLRAAGWSRKSKVLDPTSPEFQSWLCHLLSVLLGKLLHLLEP